MRRQQGTEEPIVMSDRDRGAYDEEKQEMEKPMMRRQGTEEAIMRRDRG